jgi:hypothetical protein
VLQRDADAAGALIELAVDVHVPAAALHPVLPALDVVALHPPLLSISVRPANGRTSAHADPRTTSHVFPNLQVNSNGYV